MIGWSLPLIIMRFRSCKLRTAACLAQISSLSSFTTLSPRKRGSLHTLPYIEGEASLHWLDWEPDLGSKLDNLLRRPPFFESDIVQFRFRVRNKPTDLHIRLMQDTSPAVWTHPALLSWINGAPSYLINLPSSFYQEPQTCWGNEWTQRRANFILSSFKPK